jgi:hypothetical protein
LKSDSKSFCSIIYNNKHINCINSFIYTNLSLFPQNLPHLLELKKKLERILKKVFIRLYNTFYRMKKRISIWLLLIATLLLSGCLNNPPPEQPITSEVTSTTQPQQDQQKTRAVSTTTQCTPDYVSIGVLEKSNQLSDTMAKGKCKSTCFDKYRLTSYKVKLITHEVPIVDEETKSYLCSCDTNDCGGSELVKTSRS